MKPNPQLLNFLKPYSKDIQHLLFDLRSIIVDASPNINELIWDNYNAVAIAYSKSNQLKNAFCHLAVYSKHVNFGFNRGVDLSKGILKLEGTGKLIRHIKVQSMMDFPKDEILILLKEAIELADNLHPEVLNSTIQSQSLVMSISEKKVRPKRS